MKSRVWLWWPSLVWLVAGCARGVAAEASGDSDPLEPKPSRRKTISEASARPPTIFPEDQADPGAGIFLSEMAVSSSSKVRDFVAAAESDEAFASRLRVKVLVRRDLTSFGELSKRSKSRVLAGAIELSELESLKSVDAVRAIHKKSSFVIDFDEPSLSTPIEILKARYEAPSPQQIEAFVSEYVEDKTYVRAFDIASRVALTRSGDCTEHAVLAAALLRRFGFPARVVFGIVIVGTYLPRMPPGVMAAGHAWVEYYQDEAWRRIDAALKLPEPGNSHRLVGIPSLAEGARLRRVYLPVSLLIEEGPGHARALMDQPGVDDVVRIELALEAAP